jgi:hypothetical protein
LVNMLPGFSTGAGRSITAASTARLLTR